MGGLTGALLTGVLATTAINPGGADGLLYGNAGQLGVQAISILAVAAYSGLITFVLLKLIGLVMPLRADKDEEGHGMDIIAHGEQAYATGEGAVLLDYEETPDHVNGKIYS